MLISNAYKAENDRDIYKGLTFWSPNVNIFRDPRWGRTLYIGSSYVFIYHFNIGCRSRDSSAIFIFQIDGALSTASLSNVVLTGNASFCNVFLASNGQVQIGEGATFLGTILANGAINLLEGATLFGQGAIRGWGHKHK